MVRLSLEWNSMRLGGPAHGIVTKTVHKTLPGGGGGPGVGGYRMTMHDGLFTLPEMDSDTDFDTDSKPYLLKF